MTEYVVKDKTKVRKVGRKVTLSLYYVTGGGRRGLGIYHSWSQGGEGLKVAKIRSRGKQMLPKGKRLLIFQAYSPQENGGLKKIRIRRHLIFLLNKKIITVHSRQISQKVQGLTSNLKVTGRTPNTSGRALLVLLGKLEIWVNDLNRKWKRLCLPRNGT